MTPEARLWLLATAFASAFAILATLVRSTRALLPLDALSSPLRGRNVRAAAILTRSGRALPLLVLAALSVALFAILREPLWIPLAIFASQVVSQGVVESALKHHVSRERPSDWVVKKERGFSFPSGHACTAFVFFGSWLVVALVAIPDLGLRVVAGVSIGAWMFGIAWSRVALAAHYISDVLGGALFGAAWTCATLALAIRAHVPLPWSG